MEFLPCPPPWKCQSSEDGSKVYVNDITHELSHIHPLAALFESKVDASDLDKQFSQNAEGSLLPEGELPSNNHIVEKIFSLRPRRKGSEVKFIDFTSHWKEITVSGKPVTYSLQVRYFEDYSANIHFDGVDGYWYISQLESSFGLLTRYDIFNGAQLRVFGRQVIISYLSPSACDEIEAVGKLLLKKQAWLISKIESFGKIPIVSSVKPVTQASISRTPALGKVNLRKIFNDNLKLGEQLAEMNLSRIALRGNDLFDETKLFWTSNRTRNSYEKK